MPASHSQPELLPEQVETQRQHLEPEDSTEQPAFDPPQPWIDKYVTFLLSLDPHARRASFFANKKELLTEFEKLRGCKRCEFVQFVYSFFDIEVSISCILVMAPYMPVQVESTQRRNLVSNFPQGGRPQPWILPRAQLMALFSSQRLVNLLQFDWKVPM